MLRWGSDRFLPLPAGLLSGSAQISSLLAASNGSLWVGTSAGGSTKYVNVQGYGVFIITSVDTNVVRGRAISASFAAPADPALKLARRAGLLPWEVAPY